MEGNCTSDAPCLQRQAFLQGRKALLQASEQRLEYLAQSSVTQPSCSLALLIYLIGFPPHTCLSLTTLPGGTTLLGAMMAPFCRIAPQRITELWPMYTPSSMVQEQSVQLFWITLSPLMSNSAPSPVGELAAVCRTQLLPILMLLTNLNHLRQYVTLLISPRMTVPCHIAISLPKNTSPTTVALGATKMKPQLQTLRSQRSMMLRARLNDSVYFLGAQIR